MPRIIHSVLRTCTYMCIYIFIYLYIKSAYTLPIAYRLLPILQPIGNTLGRGCRVGCEEKAWDYETCQK